MVGAMALLSSPMSMPTGVVEESCIREHPSPSGSGSPDERVPANLLANAQQHQQQQQQHSVSKRRRVAADTAAQRRRHRQQRTAQHRLNATGSRRPSRTARRDNSEDEGDEENDEDEEADEEDDDDDERDADADVEDDAIIDSRREPQQQIEKQKPLHPQHHQLPQQQQQQQQQQQLYSLRWHDFQSSILSSFRHLRDVEDFVDVTLACDGKSFTAHKMVLSACSPYFRHLLKANPCQHPIVILRDVKYRDMEALLRFMYNGEVSVSNEQLPSVLHTARMLQVKGLADVPSKHYPNTKRVSDYSNETPSSRESSTERRPLVGLVTNPPRKRVRSRSTSPILVGTGGPTDLLGSTSATVAAAVTATLVTSKSEESGGRTVPDSASAGLVVVTENGRRRRTNDDEDDDEEEEHLNELDDEMEEEEGRHHRLHVKATMDEKQQQQQQQQQQREQLLLDVHRESLLSQALEGRSSQTLMAHLLAARRSGNQSETSSRSGRGGGAGAREHHGEDDDASDSDNDTDASDRDRTDVGDLSNTEDNVYPSSGMGDHHHHRSSSLHHHASEMMVPPSGYAAHHHPLLNLQSLHSLFPPGSIPGGNGPSGGGGGGHHGRHQHDSHNNNNNNDLAQATRRSLDLMRIRATDPRPCPQCGKIYRSAHTLRTHLEDKHTVCPGYRCVLCGTVAKSRNSLHSHMSRQHRGISTKDLPVVPMPAPFDPVLASCLLAKAGVKVSPAELAARASPTSGNPRGRTADLRLDFKSPHSGSLPPGTLPPQVTIGGLQSHRNNPLQLIPLEQDPEDLSLAQQRLRGDSGRDHHHHHHHHHREKSDRSGGSSGGMATISPYGSAAGLVNRLGLTTKMGKHWLETNMQAAIQQQQQQQQANSPGSNHNASGGGGNGGGSTGSALLDTYLQLIAEHSSNMAAVAAAAAAAQNNTGAPNNNNHSHSSEANHGDLSRPESAANTLDSCVKRSPKTTADD
ncbi:hypothetical protein GHT06_009476 [Daphnia sinensis]|uniref:Protein abrupt n=1 Tax=Daphnia sinensis TaxID=1820382 RepID=A0AAD5L335_9CRUS|nr:hypothetical protein GHT06_009476 [Daphnia sinensis]